LFVLIFFPKTNNLIELNPIISQVISVLGFTILIIAAYYLRPSLRVSPIPKKNAPLIHKGIYRYIKHPMYFAVSIIALSILLNNFNEITFVVFILLYLVLRSKANMEEELLMKIHKSKFSKKKRIFPIRGI
jgi:protein-S-isoprenylcysteine O-methyltransferase Ste14